MTDGRKRWKFLLIIGSLAVLVYILIKTISTIIATHRAFDEDLPATYILSSEDSSLIREKFRNKISTNVIHRSKVREPISMLFFDQNYHLIIYKINLTEIKSLQEIIHTEIKAANRSVGYPYSVYGDNIFFNFQTKAGLTHPVSKIYLTLSGDSLKIIAKNDSVMAYHLRCKNFSLRYGENNPVDIFVKGKEGSLGRTPVIPMDILFLRRQKNVFLFVLTPRNDDYDVPAELLYRIII